MLRAASSLLLFALLLCFAGAARAEPRKLHYEPKVHVPITATAGALWVTAELLLPSIAPVQCRWCRDNAFDRAVRDVMVWEKSDRAARISDWSAFVGAPLIALGGITSLAAVDHNLGDAVVDLLVIAEAVSVAGLLNQTVKLLAARQRPFVHAGVEPGRPHDKEDNLSFYSGHTSIAFSLVVSAGTVATMRDYRLMPVIWSAGLPVALLAGTMRIAADRHYLSDVLTGAIIGSAVGALLPFLLHRPRDSEQPEVRNGTPTMAFALPF